ncbi:glycosyltransferase [Porifericola rhodea]|uniref:glycosyltransferase n=1 Tax=Porifericola rhodea TaxID=930972 RepID=UPI002665B517|nr:glycosyltransferase [Porifericola rhodea]WKN33481.1 glycosyltransferase [Porifericola rhodea]
MSSGVSIVVCCYNSASRLPKTLEHIAQQEVKKDIAWEVILVDNASSDNTQKVAEEIWKKHCDNKEINIIHEASPGLSNARNAGIHAARYEYISFIDDDNWICKNWVEDVFETMNADPTRGACGSKNIAAFDADPPDWFDTFQNLYAVGEQAAEKGVIPETKYELWGAGLTVRKSIMECIKKSNFRSLLSDRTGQDLSSGGDAELCFLIKILGYKLYYNPALYLYHYMPQERLNWSYVQKLATGFSKARFTLTSYDYFYRKANFIEKNRNLYLLFYFSYNLLSIPIILIRKLNTFNNTKKNLYHIRLVRRWGIIKSFNFSNYAKLLDGMKVQIQVLKNTCKNTYSR